MRKLIGTALLAATIAGCATNNPRYGERSPEAQQLLASYLDGKAAGPAQTCLPSYRANDQIVVDENTILYRDGSSRVWRTEMNGPCNGLGRPSTAIVTRSFGSTGLCRGEIAKIVDTSTGMTVGSCSFGDFVLYTGPRR